MKNKKRKLSLLLALSLSVTPSLVSVNQTKSYAKEVENKNVNDFKMSESFIKELDEYIVVKDKKFYVNKNIGFFKVVEKYATINKVKSDIIVDELENRLDFLNKKVEEKQIVVNYNKTYIKLNDYTSRSAGKGTTYHWWGVRHIFYSRSSAEEFGKSLQVTSDFVAAAAMVLPTGPIDDIVGALSSWYLDTLGSDIIAWGKKAPNGFNVDIAWTLNYRIYER